MLDVDVTPLLDPTSLFAAPAFAAAGACFFPDAWSNWVDSQAYELLGLKRNAVEVVQSLLMYLLQMSQRKLSIVMFGIGFGRLY